MADEKKESAREKADREKETVRKDAEESRREAERDESARQQAQKGTVANKAVPDPKIQDRNTSDPPFKDKASDKPAAHTVGDNPAKPGPGTQIPPRGMGSTPPRSDEMTPTPAGTRPNEFEQKNEDGKKGIAEGGVPATDANVVTPERMLEVAGTPAARDLMRKDNEDKELVSKPYGNRPGKSLDK